MPDLNLGPPPTRSPLPAILIAGGVLTAVFAAIFFFSPHKTAELSITGVKTYTARTKTQASKGGMNLVGTPAHVDDDLYLFVNVALTDKLRLPLFIKDETVVLTAPDGSILEGSAVQKAELPQIYAAFPDVSSMASSPLLRDTQVDPGKTAEGLVLFHFPGATDANWKARKSAALTLTLFHQDPQTIAIP